MHIKYRRKTNTKLSPAKTNIIRLRRPVTKCNVPILTTPEPCTGRSRLDTDLTLTTEWAKKVSCCTAGCNFVGYGPKEFHC